MPQIRFSQPSANFLQFFAAGIERLSPRQAEVCELLVNGSSSKEVARELGISPRTAEVHRAHVFQKTGARNLAELIKMVALISLQPNKAHLTSSVERPLRGYRAYMEERAAPNERHPTSMNPLA